MAEYSNPTGLCSVTQCFSPYISWDHISPEVLRKAAERGSMVHQCIADDIRGEYVVVDDECSGYYVGALSFMKIVDEVALVETRLTSDVHQFTGAVDLVCRIKGDSAYTLVDWKTSTIVSKSWPLQIAAYKHLVSCNNYPFKIERGMAVQLKKDGSYKIHEYQNGARDFAIFLNVISAYRYFKPEIIAIDWEAL